MNLGIRRSSVSVLATACALALALAACQPAPSATAPANDAPADAPAATTPPPSTPAPPASEPSAETPPATDEPAPTPAPNADAGQAHMDGYGDMRFGMTTAAATQAWGGELKGTTDQREGCHFLTPKWVKTPSDFAFMFEGDKFVRYDVGTAKEAAPGGGKVGMSADEIGTLYPGRIEATPHKYVEGAKMLAVKDAAGGTGKLVFETDKDGKVTHWRVGTPPQVDYVEGCG